MINIAILGFGVVGSGTAEVLTENKKIIEERLGCEYNIKYILDLRDFPDSPFSSLITHDFKDILDDPEVSVVAEMMGGSHPAYDFTKACLEAGKNVVTSNKEVVSTFGVELCEIARKNGVRYLFEASVGGGIPVIRPMINDLSSNKINKISGILNGTTNYILTSMKNEGASFDDALLCAQKLGYAEANPSADVDGIDAARKIVILAALASGKLIDPRAIPTVGITKITLADTEMAKEFGCTIKLIGYSEIVDGKLCAFVSPRFVPTTNPLSRIDDVFNGILINANMVGDVMFYGPGAGKLPTASAVVADIIDIIANIDSEVKPIVWETASESDINNFSEYSCPRVFIFNCKANIPASLSKYEIKESGNNICGIMTDSITENEADTIAAEFGNNNLISVYRVL
ncbi:MAG: homoserine dehydrogenase [Ruminococcaceae bacterium]|nr:homoserine dehydrogenase [Oscillospiraceae bacterium]